MPTKIRKEKKSKLEILSLCHDLLWQAAASGPYFFLEQSDGKILCGAGSSGVLEAPLLGGKSFFGREKLTAPWEDFSGEYYFRPSVFLRWCDGAAEIFSYGEKNEVYPEFSTAFGVQNSVQFSKTSEVPNRTEWKLFCEKADIFLREKGEKLVLSRSVSYSFDATERLKIINNFFSQYFMGAHKFMFRQNKDIFMGASPEFLFQTKNNSLHIPAIAGTRPRGKNEAEDTKFAQDLLSSEKERSEHSYVVQFIRAAAAELGLALPAFCAPEILKLFRLQHLFTPNEFPWDKTLSPLKLLEKLHPTPAMGGLPRKEALEFLRQEESYARGYFSAPIGYVLPSGEAAFVVGIRSLLLQEGSFHCFAGAGYVDGSSAEAEWKETAQKMQTILQVFGRE